MAELKGTGQKWLKAIDIFFAALWTSGGITFRYSGAALPLKPWR